MQDIGGAARDRRKSLRLTQEQVAKKAGYHKQMVSLLERNTGKVNYQTSVAILRALDFDDIEIAGLTQEAVTRNDPIPEDPRQFLELLRRELRTSTVSLTRSRITRRIEKWWPA